MDSQGAKILADGEKNSHSGRRPAPVRTAVAMLLAGSFEVVGSVSDGQAAIDAVCELKPDLVILDISMPDKSGLEVAGSSTL